METAEQWRVVPSAPDYEVSSIGRVRRCTRRADGALRQGILKPKNSRGYSVLVLGPKGSRKTRGVHQLVCEAFNGPRPGPSMHCAHIDGDKQNNIPANLYWATAKQNCEDRERHGRTHRGPLPNKRSPEAPWQHLHPEKVVRGERHYRTGTKNKGPVGEKCGNSKLTEAQVREILATPRTFGSGKMLAERFGVSMGLIAHIRHGRAWSYLSGLDTGRARSRGA